MASPAETALSAIYYTAISLKSGRFEKRIAVFNLSKIYNFIYLSVFFSDSERVLCGCFVGARVNRVRKFEHASDFAELCIQ